MLKISPVNFCAQNKDYKSKKSSKNSEINSKPKENGEIKKSSYPEFLINRSDIKKSKKINQKYKNYDALKKEVLNYIIFEKKPMYSPEIFFVRMQSYPMDEEKLAQMTILTYIASMLISKGENFEDILGLIEKEVRNINQDKEIGKFYCCKRTINHVFEILPTTRGMEYYYRYIDRLYSDEEIKLDDNIYSPKPNKEYKDANTCTIAKSKPKYGYSWIIKITNKVPSKEKPSNLKLAQKEFENLKNNKTPSLQDINKTCATIQWLIAQETPYYRGSDSVANILTKAIFNAYNIEISPLKKGISLDFEAFDTDLDEYIKNYPDFFEIAPKEKC